MTNLGLFKNQPLVYTVIGARTVRFGTENVHYLS